MRIQSTSSRHLRRRADGNRRLITVVAACLSASWVSAAYAATATAEGADPPRFELHQHSGGIEISNARSGVMCLENNEPTHVCIEAYTVPITGDSICEWSEDVDYPCTWYGYEFDLDGVQQDLVITCDVTNSIETTFGPKTDQVTGANTAQYFIDIEAGQEHLLHPAYHTYGPVREETYVISVHDCRLDDVPLYQASWRAYYRPE